MTFKIVIDSREKVDFWEFSHAGYETIIKGLKSADYSIEGFEDQISIERKKTPAELATNLGKQIVRFRNELERLRSYKVKYVLLEFSLQDLLVYPIGSDVPRKLWKFIKMNGKYMVKLVDELAAEYDIQFLYCNDKSEAEATALKILENFYKAVNNEKV